MKKVLYTITILGAFLLSTGCEKFLDINRNPNGPEKVAGYVYLGPMQQEFAAGIQWDARMVGFYNQNFAYRDANYPYDQHGTPAWTSDNGAQMWRSVYWKMGWNLTNMINQSKDETRWDLAGIGYALRAWGWMSLADHHGPIILKEAFVPDLYVFKYDNEDVVYTEVLSLCDTAIKYLQRTDGLISSAITGKGDQIYSGNRIRWKRLAFGLKAIALSHLSNKTALYDPAQVISCVDSSFVGNVDNAQIGFLGSVSADANFFGPMRNNFQIALPAKYIVSLLNGTVLGTPDPRISIMIPPTPNIVNNVAGAQYSGVTPGLGYTTFSTNDRPYTFYGLSAALTTAPPPATPGFFLFKNTAKFPLMTYSQLQFIKAEAAFRSGNNTTALTAYTAGVSTAIDFANTFAGNTTWGAVLPVTTAQKTTYLAGVVPALATNLTLSQIMTQKYIHLFGWGFEECWTDLRRYHYTDKYGTETAQVFAGFTIPAPLAAENGGKVIYRMRPRYNSEYVWNSAELDKIGGLALDYHTKPIWITIVE